MSVHHMFLHFNTEYVSVRREDSYYNFIEFGKVMKVVMLIKFV